MLQERARQLFVDTEELEVEASEMLLREGRSTAAKIMNQHAAAASLDRLVETSRSLSALLADENLQREIGERRGTDAGTFGKFYEELKEVREYHARFPSVQLQRKRATTTGDKNGEEAQVEVPVVPFSGAESHGRHLDLHSFYDAYLNLQFVKRKRERDASWTLSYRDYVSSFFVFSSSDAHTKDEEYLHYLLDVLAYLVDFLTRAQPLLHVRATVDAIAADTQRQWDEGTLRSWGDAAAPDPLYCAACAKQFAKASVFDGHLTGKKHVAAARKLTQDSEARDALAHKIFAEEVRINRLVVDTLMETVNATVAEIEKKQARTLREQLEAMEHNSEDDVDDEVEEEEDEEQGFVKQIRNYPVGWDGEPIPYWLYRLHGLGVEYKCEICGNASYWGRRAFEKHFEEFRHQNGMKLLGIPNTPHFFDVVQINHARELHRKIQEEERSKAWDPEEMVEMEDDQGRVYDKKTFEMLRKQGVIRAKAQ